MNSFVEGAVLSSTDGVNFNNEIEVEETADERALVVKKTTVNSNLSLREQLAAAEEAKQEKWKEDNNPFRPPPSLEEDDVEFFQEVRERRTEREGLAKAQDAIDTQNFRSARMDKVVEAMTAEEKMKKMGVSFEPPASTTTPSTPSTSLAIKTITKKVDKERKKEKKKKQDKKEKKKEKKGGEPPTKRTKPDDSNSSGLLGLLGGYSSDGSDKSD